MAGQGRRGDSVLMAKLNLSVMDTHDRAVWRNGILGNRLTRAVARKNDIKR